MSAATQTPFGLPKLALARTRTALTYLPRTSEALGVEFWIKRDDQTGVEVSGNKVRKLEYLLADAVAKGATLILTCGGEQSNHARATAFAAATLGLRAQLVLRTTNPAKPPRSQGNILLDELVGADIRWISRPDWQQRNQIMAALADEARRQGEVPYVIPEGGSNALGSLGYVECAQELEADLAPLPSRTTTVVYACGSGGTGAGLIAGAAVHGFAAKGWQVAGFNVCDDRAYFESKIGGLLQDMAALSPALGNVAHAPIDIVDGYVGRGYALSRPEETQVIREFCRREGIVVDPVYTGKALFGLVVELQANPRRFGERVVFVHTGGIYGWFKDDAQ